MTLLLSSLEFAHDYFWAYRIVIVIITMIFVMMQDKQHEYLNKWFVPISCLIIVLFITFRPNSWKYFGDTTSYIRMFRHVQEYTNAKIIGNSDVGLGATILIFKNLGLRMWFFFFAFLYVASHYIFCKKTFNENAAFAFILVIGAFSFTSYGFNGMRNGAACALVMCGFIYPSQTVKAILFLLAISFHKSVLLPIVAYYATAYYSNTKVYIFAWCACLAIATLFSDTIGDFQWLSNLIGDDRLSSYMNARFNTIENASKISFSSTGFRWDYVAYGAVPIILGWITIVRNEINDEWYTHLLNIYVTCNAAWLFTASLPFNNRFAYLSWFLMPFVLAYPFILNESLNTNIKINCLVIFYLIIGFAI